MKSNSRGREAFTLVEILVVLLIIAMLMALLTPTVIRALTKSRNAAIKAEIDMLHMAIMNYKNEYGSFPPAVSDDFTATSPAFRHLRRLFPRCTDILSQFSGASQITPQNALASWLLGYTNDPTEPLQPPANRKKLYDLDQSRLNPVSGLYTPAGLPGSPFIYIDAPNYLSSSVAILNFPLTGGTYFGQRMPTTAAPTNFADPSQPAFNPDTFQILCAGRDGEFGTDDDLSNFWPGTRREYLESLKN